MDPFCIRTASDSHLNPEFLLKHFDSSDLNRKKKHFERYHFSIDRGIQVGALKGHPKPFVTGFHYDRWIPFV